MLYRLCKILAIMKKTQVLGFMANKENTEESGTENILSSCRFGYFSKDTS